MDLKFIMEQVHSSELKSFSENTLTDKIILSYINLGCIDLYNRFGLSTDILVINMKSNKLEYLIDGSDDDVRRLFNRPLIEGEISTLRTAMFNGSEIPINDQNSSNGIYSFSFDTLIIPFAKDDEYLEISYEKNFTPIDTSSLCNNEDSLDYQGRYNVRLPLVFATALVLYIGFRANNRLSSSMEDDNNTYYIRYQAECKRLKSMGASSIRDSYSHTVSEKGFK